MKRRSFLTSTLAARAALAQSPAPPSSDVVIERAATGQPHAGKVLALIEPHLDDGPIFAGGTIAKLLHEGYTGYLIRTSNDEKDSLDLTLGETVLANERDSRAFIKTMGLQQVFDLSYRNHRMDDVSRNDIRQRLIFLFRLLKIDTVFTYDPWGHYEENPDHYVTAQAVEAACWMAGGRLDYPEHFAAGLKPHSPREKYYFARGPQLVNRVVDISTTIDKKMACIHSNQTMIKHMVGDLKAELAERNLKLPILDADDATAIRSYADLAFRNRDARVGQRHRLQYAEAFHHIGPSTGLDNYIAQHAVPLR
ncbi:MAG TPA: PIG-L family deacetylase [Bryobacterales bacterium]|nr:PIG-L family deacetylase [Bryobacterales bacterium]